MSVVTNGHCQQQTFFDAFHALITAAEANLIVTNWDGRNREKLCVNEASKIIDQESEKNSKEILTGLSQKDPIDSNVLQSIIQEMLSILESGPADYALDAIGSTAIVLMSKLQPILQTSSTFREAMKWQVIESISIANHIELENNYNHKLLDDWDNLRQQLKASLTELLVEARLETSFEKEKYFQRLTMVMKLEASDIFNAVDFYDSIRHQRLERHVEPSEKVEIIIKIIKQSIEVDLELVNDYHLLHGQISYQQIVIPYIHFVKELVQERIKVHYEENVHPEKLIEVVSALNGLNKFFTKGNVSLTSIDHFAPQFNEIWDWQSYFLSLGLDNTLLRYLNQGLLEIMTDELELKRNVEDEGKILESFRRVFEFLDQFDDVNLPGFTTSFSVIVNVSVIDFMIKTVNKLSENSSLETKYLLLNSVIFAKNRVSQWGLSVIRINLVCDKLRASIISHHLIRLMLSLSGVEHALLYLSKLSNTLRHYLTNEREDERHLFICILRQYFQLTTKIDFPQRDVLLLCRSVIYLAMPYSESQDELLSDRFEELYGCCMVLLFKCVIKDPTIETEKIKSTNDSQMIPSRLCWMNILGLLSANFWSNYMILSGRIQKPKASSIIRPFLESRCVFSEKLFTQVNVNPENADQIVGLLRMVIKVTLLDDSQENCISSLLTAIIRSNDEWTWLCSSSFFSSHPRPWWLRSLDLLFDELVSPFLSRIMPPFVFRYCLNAEQFSSFFEKADALDKLEEFSQLRTCENCSKAILSCISSVAQTMPPCLVTNLENLRKSSPRRINVLFSSLTGQFIFSAILRNVKEKSTLDEQEKNCNQFYESVFQCLRRIVQKSHVCDFVGQELDSAMKVKETLREDCIVASEFDRFELLGRLMEREADYEEILNNLFNFFVANKDSFAKPENLRTSFEKIKITFASLEATKKPSFDIIEEFQRLRSIPSELTTDQTRKLTELAGSLLFNLV